MIPSRDDYASFIRHFEEIFISENNPAQIINTSTSGAYIGGMAYMEFKDFIKNLKPQQFNVNETLSEAFDKTSEKWQKTCQSIIRAMDNFRSEILELDRISNNIQKELVFITDLMESPDKNAAAIIQKFDLIKNDLINVRNKVLENPLLSSYLQQELWIYTKSYRTSLLPNIKDVKHNVEVESTFINLVCWATDNILKWIDEAIETSDFKPEKLKV